MKLEELRIYQIAVKLRKDIYADIKKIPHIGRLMMLSKLKGLPHLLQPILLRDLEEEFIQKNIFIF